MQISYNTAVASLLKTFCFYFSWKQLYQRDRYRGVSLASWNSALIHTSTALHVWTRGCTHLATLHVASSTVKFQRKLERWSMMPARLTRFGTGASLGREGFGTQAVPPCVLSFWWLVWSPAVQEMYSSTAVVFVQPGRVVRVLFAFVTRSTERLQTVGRKSLISHVCALSCWAEAELVWWGGRGVYDVSTSLYVSGH